MGISVALCTYNGEKFLEEQLESISIQTRIPNELVVCDDGSHDSTLDVLNKYKKTASFEVKIFCNKENLGSTRNFEKAISLCGNDIVALSDQDDVWKPNKLRILEETLITNPEAGYVFSNAELVDENLKPLDYLLWDSIGFSGEVRERFKKGDQFHCFLKQHFVTGATMAFRANLGKLAMPFPTQGNWIHDGWIALVASAIGAWGVPIDEPLIAYRQHSNQQIGAPVPSAATEVKSLRRMYRELKSKENELFEEWENHCSQVLSVSNIVKDRLENIKNYHGNHLSLELEKNMKYLRGFKIHFLNRKKILTSREMRRYSLICREVFSGRYAQFSDSWRSIFRDLFL